MLRLFEFWDDLFPPELLNGSSAGGPEPSERNSSAASGFAQPQHLATLPSHPAATTILVVTHGGVIKALFPELHKGDSKLFWEDRSFGRAKAVWFKVPNFSISEILMTKSLPTHGRPDGNWSGTVDM